MVLSPNDGQVANSSDKHTQFKTRVHKPYPISDQNGQKKPKLCGTYLDSLFMGLPPPQPPRGEKSVADYESRCLLKRSLCTDVPPPL